MKNGKEGGSGMLERIDDMAGIAVVKAKYLGFKAKEQSSGYIY